MLHKIQEELKKELDEASKRVVIGGTYTHYKNPTSFYKVIGLGFQEATDKICVIYQADYGERLIFVRDLDNWLAKPEVADKKIERFKLTKV